MITRPILTIHSSADLAQLGRYARGQRLAFHAIKLDSPKLTEAERAATEVRLNRLYFSCGCAEATALGLVGLVGALLWIGWRSGGGSMVSWWDPAYVLGVFFLASGLGKWLGLQRARFALSDEIASLRARLGDQLPPLEERPRCAVS